MATAQPPSGRKVALIAVASREGAYVTEWLAHHLRLGFSPIVVVVNRCDEGTSDIVTRIAGGDPRVVHLDGDYLDPPGGTFNRAIQEQAYADALTMLTPFLDRQDYTAFLDIDEFWWSAEIPGEAVQSYIDRTGGHSVYSFNWLMVDSDDAPFAATIVSGVTGAMHPLVKSAVRLDTGIAAMRIHVPEFHRDIAPFNPSGLPLDTSRCRTTSVPPSLPGALVLHRCWRSPVEYLALLGRTSANRPNLRFKQNRAGYRRLDRSIAGISDRVEVPVPEAEATEHADTLAALAARHDLTGPLRRERHRVFERARRTLADYEGLSDADRAAWDRQFSGLALASLGHQIAAGLSAFESRHRPV